MTIPAPIADMESRLRSALRQMFSDGKFNDVERIISDALSRLEPGSGSYQLLFKSQVMGFGADGSAPAAVNILGNLSTGSAQRPHDEDSRRTSISYGVVDLKSTKPCPSCQGSGFDFKALASGGNEKS